MELPKDWLIDAFVEDESSERMEQIQGRRFLRAGVSPCVGQQVSLKTYCKNDAGHRRCIRLTGQVVGIKPEPTSYRPMENDADKDGSMYLSQALGSHFHHHPSILPDGMTLKHCNCGSPECGGGVLYASREIWEKWELCDCFTKAFKQNYFGAIHNQKVVCEARLHFDHDRKYRIMQMACLLLSLLMRLSCCVGSAVRRGNEEGPWSDGIPIDGRDVWQFTLVLNDHMENMWVVEKESFRNLGPDRRPRCWPWSTETELPYERSGVDSHDINDEYYLIHYCLGPFGCSGDDHPHNFAGAA